MSRNLDDLLFSTFPMTIPPPATTEPAARVLAVVPLRVAERIATWRDILPAHRMPVVAKTPLIIAVGVYLSGGSFAENGVAITMLLAAALWGVLYAFNEATDVTAEESAIVPRPILFTLHSLVILLCLASTVYGVHLALPFFGMVVSQYLYCAPPARIKRYWWGNVLLSGTINPILRLLCGVHWGVHGVSALIYATFFFSHLGAALRARTLLRERDGRLGYTIAPKGSETVGKIATALGILGSSLIIGRGELPPYLCVFVAILSGYAVYTWSGSVRSVKTLRRGWVWFAILSIISLIVLFARGGK